jgi:hypothetical protein
MVSTRRKWAHAAVRQAVEQETNPMRRCLVYIRCIDVVKAEQVTSGAGA